MSQDEMPENEVIARALHMWANYIETGTVIMSAADAINQKKPLHPLTLDQQKFVIRLRDMAIGELTGGKYV